MGLRGCVDAWGEPVKKPELGGLSERFKPEPSLTSPESNKAESNKPSLTALPSLTAPQPHRAAKKPKPAPKPAAPVVASAAEQRRFDRGAYQRELMRARRAKAKASKS